MPTKDVLIINSYAGSLTIAASQLKLRILGSYEDCGFGLDTQRLNFPKLNFVPEEPWPTGSPKLNAWKEPIPGSEGFDLKQAMVIAHPPCAAFSLLGKRYQDPDGLKTDHFKRTAAVVAYATKHKAKALMIESVCGTAAPTTDFYNKAAKKAGYRIYRLFQNAVTFGTGQYRDRFWVVMVRGDIKLPKDMLILTHRPVVNTVSSVMDSIDKTDGWTKHNYTIQQMERATEKMRKVMKFSTNQIRDIWSGECGFGPINSVIATVAGETSKDIKDKLFPGRYSETLPRILDPNGFTPVIIEHSAWVYNGWPLKAEEYCVFMGFPYDYHFAKEGRRLQMLSKGVCPPVAKWLLEQVRKNIDGEALDGELLMNVDRRIPVAPGEVADFRVNKNQLTEKGRSIFADDNT